ncbi:unnamed protein product, partial [Prorocentrum cordatum]
LSDATHGGLLRKQGTSGSLASEDDDMLTSVSRAASMRDQRTSVIGLRDRLLKEARSERQRCLENAEAAERRKLEARGACEVPYRRGTLRRARRPEATMPAPEPRGP